MSLSRWLNSINKKSNAYIEKLVRSCQDNQVCVIVLGKVVKNNFYQFYYESMQSFKNGFCQDKKKLAKTMPKLAATIKDINYEQKKTSK